MKKVKYVFLLGLILFSFNYVVSASVTGTVNVNDSLTLRKEPSTSSEALTSFYNGTVVTILDTNAGSGNGCPNNWYKVSYGNYTGYSCGTYITVNNTSSNDEDDSYSRYNYDIAPSKDGTIACYEDTGSVGIRSNVNGSRTGKVVDCGEEIDILNVVNTVTVTSSGSVCPYWYQIQRGSDTGYICGYFVNTTKLSSTAENYYNSNSNGETKDSYKTMLKEKGFPDSYIPYLLEIHARHPNWNFVAEKINLNFDDVVNGESVDGRNLLQRSSVDDGYLSTNSHTYDILNNKFSEYSGEPGWYNASKEATAYYLDPRTYLNEKYIFAFETLEYRDNQAPSIIESFFSGKTLFDKPYSYYNNQTKGSNGLYSDGSTGKYSNDIVNASKSANVSALHVSSRMLQEVGSSGSASSSGNSFTYCGQTYSGYYNFFNIGAYATDCATNIQNGLYYAKNQGWDTPYKAIVGGAKFLTNNYISINQDTIYYEKFDVSTGNGNYTHQYQQNLTAPISEGGTTYNGYYNSLKSYLDSAITFVIPIYNNMPNYAVTAPKLGNPNNYLKDLTIDGKNVSNFNYNTYNYNVYLNSDVSSVKINATSIVSTSNVTGTGTIQITSNQQTNKIVVTAANGKKREYSITFNRQASNPITIEEAMNNSGYKYNENYLFGINVGTNVSSLIGNITSYNNSVTVSIKSSTGAIKTNDSFRTGDKITVTGSDGSKEYVAIIYGDVNGDGMIDKNDLLYVQSKAFGYTTFDTLKTVSADINKDGKVDKNDLLYVQSHVFGYSKINQG